MDSETTVPADASTSSPSLDTDAPLSPLDIDETAAGDLPLQTPAAGSVPTVALPAKEILPAAAPVPSAKPIEPAPVAPAPKTVSELPQTTPAPPQSIPQQQVPAAQHISFIPKTAIVTPAADVVVKTKPSTRVEPAIPDVVPPIPAAPTETTPVVMPPVPQARPAVLPKVETVSESEIERKTEEIFGKSSIKSVRTFQSDVAESIRSKSTSVAGVVLAEENRRRELIDLASPTSKTNLFLIIASSLLVIGGVVLTLYVTIKKNTESVTTVARTPALLFAENETNIAVSGLDAAGIARAIAAEVKESNNKLDTIEHLTFTETIDGTPVPLTAQRLFFFLDNRMTPALLRSLAPDFMLGVHTFNGNHPFIVLKTDYYENAFAGMLAWEQYISRDLFPLWGIELETESAIHTRAFEDITIKNRDARVLRGDDGKPLLFYVFRDKQTLIITDSSDTLDEVIRRLNSASPLIK